MTTMNTSSTCHVLSCDGTRRVYALDLGRGPLASRHLIERIGRRFRSFIGGNSQRTDLTIGTFRTKREAVAALIAPQPINH